MPRIPNPDTLIANYPSGSADQVKKQIGGNVDGEWIKNTCAIRMSRSLNYSGCKIPRKEAGMNTIRGGDNLRYAYRVREMARWMEQKFGKADYRIRGNGSHSPPPQIRGKKGIIAFIDCGWSDATGHYDLFDGEKCVGHGYFERAKWIYLWVQKAPRTHPNATAAVGQVGTVTATTLNVRSRPSTSGQVVGKLRRNEQVPILEVRQPWYRVAEGAWVHGRYVQVT